MIRLSELLGQPTIALSSAEHTGRVQGVVLDGDRVVAVHNGEGVVEASGIRSFEGDAVTYDGPVRQVPDGADELLGRRVLDTGGDELGRLADLDIDATGRVELLRLDDARTVPGAALRVVGSYAVIVATNADTTLRTD